MLPELQIFTLINQHFGRNALTCVRKWENYANREGSVCEQLFFLHNCIRYNAFPKSVTCNTPVKSEQARKIATCYAKQMRRELINDAHRRRNSYQKQCEHHKTASSQLLNQEWMTKVEDAIRVTTTANREKVKKRMNQKFERLTTTSSKATDAVHNFSDHQLTQDEHAVLLKGLKFNHADANTTDFIASFEAGLKRCISNDNDQQQIRTKVCQQLQSHRAIQCLTKQENRALIALKNNKKIVILPTDKGNGITLLNKKDYHDKINQLLQDEETYEKLEQNPIKTLRNQVAKKVATLKKQKLLTEKQYRFLLPREGPVPRLYGLPKIHKDGTPLRPIVASRCSPTYRLAQFLFRTLSPCMPRDDHDANSSIDFLHRIKDIKLEENELMVSFDVSSLFTNIPIETALCYIKQMIDEDTSLNTRTMLSREDLMELLKLCLTTYLQFNNKIFRQKRGAPMGSPLSGLLADAAMKHFESRAFLTFKPKVWLRYVDDTFVILPREMVDDFQKHLNEVVPGIAFTRETEENHRLPFLDILVIRLPDGSIQTTVHRKPTTTEVILNFGSNHPASHLKSCVRTLFRRADTHCSTGDYRAKERKTLFKLFTANGYPKSFIQSCLRTPKSIHNREKKTNKMMVLPYVRGTSEATERLLRPLGIQVAHKPTKTLRSNLVKAKDRVEPYDQSGIVYSIPCLGCDQRYIGETGKQLRTRLHEHKLALRRADPKSQIWHHCSDTGHEINIDQAKVVARAEVKGERLVLEALFSRNSFNRHVDIDSHYPIITRMRNEMTVEQTGNHG